MGTSSGDPHKSGLALFFEPGFVARPRLGRAARGVGERGITLGTWKRWRCAAARRVRAAAPSRASSGGKRCEEEKSLVVFCAWPHSPPLSSASERLLSPIWFAVTFGNARSLFLVRCQRHHDRGGAHDSVGMHAARLRYSLPECWSKEDT